MQYLSEFLFFIPFFSVILYLLFFNKWRRHGVILFLSFLPTIFFVIKIVHHPLEAPIGVFNFYLFSLIISIALNIAILFIIERKK